MKRTALLALASLDELKTLLALAGTVGASVLAALSPAIKRWFEARTELRKLEIQARQLRVREEEEEAAAIVEAERRALDDSWNSVERRNSRLDRHFQRMLAAQTREIQSLREEVTRLGRMVERFSGIEQRCEEAEAQARRLNEEGRMLRDLIREAGLTVPHITT